LAIRVRRGLKKDFDPNKLLSGELATPLDTRELYAAFAPGDVQKIATYENVQSMVTGATEEVVENLTVEVNAATESAQTATQGANAAATYAQTQGDYAKAQGDAAQAITLSKIATDTALGVVKGSGDISVGSDGKMTVNGKGAAGGFAILGPDKKVLPEQLPIVVSSAENITYGGTLGANVKLALDQVSLQLSQIESLAIKVDNELPSDAHANQIFYKIV
jgi:hypothetical protein